MKQLRVFIIVVLLLGLFVGTTVAQSNWPRGHEISASYEIARRILGNDLVSPLEISQARGLSYTKEQLKHFEDALPSEEILRWCKANSYAVMAGPPVPMGLLEVRSLRPEPFYSKGGWWYEGYTFSKNDKAESLWLAIRT